MKKTATFLLLSCFVLLCNKNLYAQNASLHKLFDSYYEDKLKLFPLLATSYGDYRYNDVLPNDGSAQYIKQLSNFYDKYLAALKKYNRQDLNMTDRTSYDLLEYLLKMGKELISYHPEYMPIAQIRNQFFNLPVALTIGIWGGGKSQQPFKTIKDYQDWLKRIAAFPDWVDTAVANFNKGIKAGIVLPKALVVKMIPQMQKLAEPDSNKNIFYGPVRNFPESFTAAQRTEMLNAYYKAITTQLIPAYSKLAEYLKNDYLPHVRSTSGYNALPNGKAIYNYYVRLYTTTNKTPEEIYKIGLSEVDGIHKEMEQVKTATGFKGTLPEFYKFLTTDSTLLPFKNPQEVLDAYEVIRHNIEPHLPELFDVQPKTPLVIKQTEAFRAASAVEEYIRGTPDGKRAGTFYVPVVDAAKYQSFNMEDVFLHEAIPGHHYQYSLESEDISIPRFRRYAFLPAFQEGWALYAETLGKQLGVYTNPYQYMGFLQDDIHRAIRLVVDVAIHTGKMTREEAIKYMMDNEPVTEDFAIAEVERYMAWPGQTLSYKIGALKIEELRDKYKKQLGEKFSLKNFHDAVLKGGALPLNVFESYMDDWAITQK